MEKEDTFLTETQKKILKLREKGLSQSEVAEKLDSSRANICSIEKRAKRNIDRAKKTVELAERIRAPISIEIKAGEDVLDSAKTLFSKADEAGIHVGLDTPELISRIEEKAKEKLKGRRAEESIELSLTSKGNIIVS